MTTQSDLPIPRTTAIIARALDIRESAVRQNDPACVRQIDRLIDRLPGARLCWVLGTLHIASPSGGRYRVSRAGCSCPNGTKSHARACWHVSCFELLLDMFDTECETRDMAAECDPPGDNPLGDDEGDSLPSARALGARLCAARPMPTLTYNDRQPTKGNTNMIFVTKTTTGVLLQRDELEIEVDHFAIPSTLGLIIGALIDSGRALGEARRSGYEAGLNQGYAQCERELAMSARITERRESDLVDALLISGLVQAA